MSEDEDAAEVSIADGKLSARKASGVAAMQLLLTGCTEDDVNLSRDMAGFSIKAKQTSQGVKVVIYNLNCETMAEDGYNILTGLPEGTTIQDVRLSNENAERMSVRILSGNLSTGIGETTLSGDLTEEGLIYDMEGRIVAKGNVSEELRKLPAGIYVLNIGGKTLKVKK